MRLEEAIDDRQTGDHHLNHFFTLFVSNRRWSQRWIGVILIGQEHDGEHRPAMFVAVDQVTPTSRSGLNSAHKAQSPIVAVSNAIVILQQHWQIHVRLLQRVKQYRCNRIPVAHDEPHHVGSLSIALKTEILAQDLWQVLAGKHHLRTTDQCRKIAVEHFNVHGR
ncbi:hypothetical protein AL051_26870 [Pseudomonas amygdali pv. dendropanacis]|nr:hypothetical protein AL051_26870 [Pseudomonas amygdali pv. dendropanacis]